MCCPVAPNASGPDIDIRSDRDFDAGPDSTQLRSISVVNVDLDVNLDLDLDMDNLVRGGLLRI